MGLPEPPTSLDGSCSFIHENTLYSYSPQGFLSLSLSGGSKWKKLSMGESVSGAVCVGTSTGDAGLWIVGGTGGSAAYTGLQKYSFSTKQWATITPAQLITQNRQYHGAVYLPNDDQILIYAGRTDGVSAPSADTWTIQASPPYGVESHPPSSHPAIKPILLRFSDTDACLVGGDPSNTAIALFNPTTGWTESQITLSQGLPKDTSSMQAILINGDDNSKSLYTFDLSTSPNTVLRYLVQNADGSPVSNSPALTKRELSQNNWPEYNSTLAPSSTRTNFAIAQSDDNTIVFSGGNTEVPLVIFDATENSWVNASDVFAVQKAEDLHESSSTKTKSHSSTTSHHSSTIASSTSSLTTSAVSDASSTATATDVAAVGAGSNGSSGLSSNTVLAITLGSILGFLALLLVLLLLLRRRKRVKQPSGSHDRGLSSDEKAPIVFNDAPPPLSSPGHLRGHNSQFSQDSFSSMAILMGRTGKPKTGVTRKASNDSTRGATSPLHDQLKATISKPILQDMQHPVLRSQESRGVAFDANVAEPRPREQRPVEVEDGMRRSSGWNRYWSGGSALQILGYGNGPKKLSATADDRSSHYSESTQQQNNPRVTQDSATVPPLNFDFQPELNRVNSGSPIVASYSDVPFKDGVAVKIERHTSKASSGYSSGIPESVHEQWVGDHSAKEWGADRAPNDAYHPSFYFGTPLSPSNSPPPRYQKSGVSTQPQLAMASTSSDMSWLNLGDKRM
ncbi:hypothetical protein BGZ63DRAFT_411468 [Mariannaea sp. PMI_226]|nr:hypothetical protein BGZ63DRAFT_411468 [Mariannaea sp. PMI_226]